MTASGTDVQAKLDAAVLILKKATTAPASMVAKHGPDPAGWPNGYLKSGFLGVAAARDEAGSLVSRSGPPTAEFSLKAVV